jgi:flagellar biogenesis protein FliO
MSALLHRHITRPKNALPDFAGLVHSFIRWLSVPRRPAGKLSLQLLESVSLSAETSIALVGFEREVLLLGVTPHNVTVLVRRESPAPSAETPAKTPTGPL